MKRVISLSLFIALVVGCGKAPPPDLSTQEKETIKAREVRENLEKGGAKTPPGN